MDAIWKEVEGGNVLITNAGCVGVCKTQQTAHVAQIPALVALKGIVQLRPNAADYAAPREVRRYRTERAAHRARWRRLLAELDRELSRD